MGIPTTVIVLKKSRVNKDVLFIDASKDFNKEKNQNTMSSAHINAILDAYIKREDIEKYAHVASFEEIVKNDYNLNIPRYVDSFEEEEPIDIVAVSREIISLNAKIYDAEAAFLTMLDDLVITDESRELIEATKEVFRHG